MMGSEGSVGLTQAGMRGHPQVAVGCFGVVLWWVVAADDSHTKTHLGEEPASRCRRGGTSMGESNSGEATGSFCGPRAGTLEEKDATSHRGRGSSAGSVTKGTRS